MKARNSIAGLAVGAVAVAALHTALHAIVDRPEPMVVPVVFLVVTAISTLSAFTLGAFAIYWLNRYQILSLRSVLSSGFVVGVIPWAFLLSVPSVASVVTAVLWCGSLGVVGAFIWWRVTGASANKPLVPTRTGEAPVLAAQRRRWASERR